MMGQIGSTFTTKEISKPKIGIVLTSWSPRRIKTVGVVWQGDVKWNFKILSFSIFQSDIFLFISFFYPLDTSELLKMCQNVQMAMIFQTKFVAEEKE